ncbi:MAG: hypothetical protein CME62_06980 [Halobacteriovoraceae bacterium]|nr:hypothetical protein [Halobacteriovoraceae bacterium]|tara:strand:- start:1859 stop:2164 length:306 start_codon:yes stop_codon:yes gene_type:complete
MQKLILLSALFSLIVSCAVSKTKLSDEGREVKILPDKNNPNCHVVDTLVAENEQGSDELARNYARNLAADKGGDALLINQVVSNGKKIRVYGTVYHCDHEH